MEQDSQAELTINDIALALMGVQLAQAWSQEQRPRSDFGRRQTAALKALNRKLTDVLDKFSLPRNDEGEVPDNGDDRVSLTWDRAR